MNRAKVFSLICFCLCTIMLQIQGICIILQSNVFFRSDILLKSLLARQNFHLNRLKNQNMLRLMRSPRSVWYKTERTDQWWVNMIDHSLSDEEWKKTFDFFAPNFSRY